MCEFDEKCRKCKNIGTKICNRCDMFYDEFDPIEEPKQTNADRIRSMTDEELAHTLWLTAKGGIIGQRSEDEWLDWLKEEVET